MQNSESVLERIPSRTYLKNLSTLNPRNVYKGVSFYGLVVFFYTVCYGDTGDTLYLSFCFFSSGQSM